MSDRLQRLYQETILEHNKNPRHFGDLDGATHMAHGKNPLCGDDYWIFVKLDGETITDVSFKGSGCAISKSSGSMMSQEIIGKSTTEVLAKKNHFLDLMMKDEELMAEAKEHLGKLKVFEGVKKYPIRVKCATLVWRALEAAISGGNEITTE